MKKNYYRRNKWNIYLFIIVLVASYLAIKYNFVATKNIDKDFQVNMLTVNSIFAGFLYTSLGIMASIVDKKRISRLDEGGYMDNYFNGIYIGLFFHTTSIVIAAISVVNPVLNHIAVLIMIEQLALLAGISFFIKSVLNIIKIIQKVRSTDKK
jgi:uncharacterized membrane protein YadS